MKKIKYYNGKKTIEVEVTDEFEKEYQILKRKEWRNTKAKQRNENYSLDFLNETGIQFIDENSNIEEIYFEKENRMLTQKRIKTLHTAMKSLSPKQQKIVELAFYKNKTHSEIGQAMGVSKQSIQQQMQTIYKKLKKFF